MTAFSTNRLALTQEHFSVLEIDLPAFSSGQTCTLSTGTAFFTPISCDETWDGTTYETYYFSTAALPRGYGRPPSASGMPAGIIDTGKSKIHRVISGISETVTELKPGQGLALQGSAKVTLTDFSGDPGPVTESTTGTYFGKLAARNVLTNKQARIKHYHVNSTGIYEANDALTRYYIIDTLGNNGKGSWNLSLKDELSKLDKDKNQFPAPTGGTIRTAVNDSTTTIPVNSGPDWLQGLPGTAYTVKVGDELMKVTALIDSGDAVNGPFSLTVATRGAAITFTNQLSITSADTHEVGDDVQICYTSDNQDINLFLEAVLESSGIESARIPDSDWAAEVAEWHAGDKINTIWHEPQAANDVVKQVTNDFLLDIWFDNEDREVKLSAITVWTAPGPLIEYGKGINFNSFKVKPRDRMRYTRAFIYWNKPNKVSNDDIENYKNLSLNVNTTLEGEALYGEPKAKEFPNSHIIGSGAADLLTQRYVARFGFTPNEYAWETEERFLNFKTGDVATLITGENQNFDGTAKEERAQILSVQPVYSPKNGRSYKVKALTFEAALSDGAEVTISTAISNESIHLLFGAPSQVIDVTLIIDGALVTSAVPAAALTANSPSTSFAAGSTITIILINGAEMQGMGGNGGAGGNSEVDFSGEPPEAFLNNYAGVAGIDGGVVYDAQGIDTLIYLAGSAPGSRTADGILKAPGGGGGGENGNGTSETVLIGGDGGGGGAGSAFGTGGSRGVAYDPLLTASLTNGTAGSNGDAAGNGGSAATGAGAGGDWGAAGAAGDGAAGAAGKGIVSGGATVTVYYDGTSSLIVNGGGDSFTIG